MELVDIARHLRSEVAKLEFAPPVACVYNPLEYAWEPHAAYLERYGRRPKEVVFLGMNPGPWGMAQTGVPFGEVGMVREWLRIDGHVGQPRVTHPKRPVRGFACHRSEVSGKRLWGWAAERYATPEAFFARFFVANYCPLVFMQDSGANLTPDKLPRSEREPLFSACDAALRALVERIEPRWVVGIGAFAQGRARQALEGMSVRIGCVLHPSPASPKANRGWARLVEADLEALGIPL